MTPTFLTFHLQLELTHPPLLSLSFSSYASAAKDRLTGLISHLTAQGKDALTAQNPDDVVICAAVRTPITRAKKGGFKDTCPEDLLVAVFKGVVERSGVDINLVEEIQVGNVLPPGGGATVARMAQLAGKSLTHTYRTECELIEEVKIVAGFPSTSSIATVNRQCSSGLIAVNHIALQIAAGQIDIGIGAGVESMTMGYGAGVMPEKVHMLHPFLFLWIAAFIDSSFFHCVQFSESVLENEGAADCLLPMGITSESKSSFQLEETSKLILLFCTYR